MKLLLQSKFPLQVTRYHIVKPNFDINQTFLDSITMSSQRNAYQVKKKSNTNRYSARIFGKNLMLWDQCQELLYYYYIVDLFALIG